MRFKLPLLALFSALMFVLAACGGDGGESTTSASGSGSAEEGGVEGASFPQTVEHRFGKTVVSSEPKRIVIVGLTEQDTVLQLGYKPIATTEWYGGQPSAVWPWAQNLLGDAKPEVIKAPDGFDFEKVASLRPDLIIGTNSGMKQEDYDKFSKLAPTIPGAKGATDYFGRWDQQVELISQALGKPEEGKRLIEDIRAKYAEVAAEHPDWKGKTVTFSQNGFYSGSLYVYPKDLNTEFLTMLGFEINPKLTPLVEKPGEQVQISKERLDVIDADVIVFATESPKDIPKFKKVPGFDELDAVKGRRAVYTDGTLAGAIYFITPLSLQYVLDRLTPQLEQAVAGKAPQRIIDPDA